MSEYRVFDANEVGGVLVLGYSGGKYGTRNPEKYTDYADRPISLKAKQAGDYYYAARVTVTGQVEEDLEGCRYWYEKKGREYWQDIPCQTTIRLGTPVPGES